MVDSVLNHDKSDIPSGVPLNLFMIRILEVHVKWVISDHFEESRLPGGCFVWWYQL
jgi:hypothetical protein